jgi:hypothetical protein
MVSCDKTDISHTLISYQACSPVVCTFALFFEATIFGARAPPTHLNPPEPFLFQYELLTSLVVQQHGTGRELDPLLKPQKESLNLSGRRRDRTEHAGSQQAD